ncbi:hypothetical protein [Limosilactobacillus sp.]|uniref:hypothetical protein n=1 Tax=Limosilactobacillus sp. TaxID=2773925 RepID=UPI003F0AA3B4
MNCKKIIKQSCVELLQAHSIDNITLKEIITRAEICKQTFYRYFLDKYVLGNSIYYDFFIKEFYKPNAKLDIQQWNQLYINKFNLFLKHQQLVRNLYSSQKTGCTTEFETKQVIAFDKACIQLKGGDTKNPAIAFSIEAKDVGGTQQLRNWILQGFQFSPEKMANLFQNSIPANLISYY